MEEFNVVLVDGTEGVIFGDSLNGQKANDFIGERVTIQTWNEMGEAKEITGILKQVL